MSVASGISPVELADSRGEAARRRHSLERATLPIVRAVDVVVLTQNRYSLIELFICRDRKRIFDSE